MKRSEVFAVQKFAEGAGVEVDAVEAESIVRAREILATPERYSAKVLELARNVLADFNNVRKGEQPKSFAAMFLPFTDDTVTEDVDEAKLDESDQRLLHLPAISREEWNRTHDSYGHVRQ